MQTDLKKHITTTNSNNVLAAVKSWWHKGKGGEWYEPYITNGDVVICCLIGLVGGLILAVGCCLLYPQTPSLVQF